MALYRKRYRIESTRHPAWNYGNAGWYYVTICTADHERFFGEVVDGEMRYSREGRLACRELALIPTHFPNVRIDTFQVMPDHLHAIIVIEQSLSSLPNEPPDAGTAMSRISPRCGSLPTIIRSFKGAMTRLSRRGGRPDFAWQERYHDRIIRSERALDNIRQYIRDNPARWCKPPLA